MNSSIENLSQAIGPDCAGIIWLTDKKLNYSMSGVYEFNYLLDGLLTKSIANTDETNDDSHLFLAQNFGNSFFIAHSIIKNISELEKIQKHISVVNNMISENKYVLVYNEVDSLESETVQGNLSKKFKAVKFNLLKLHI